MIGAAVLPSIAGERSAYALVDYPSMRERFRTKSSLEDGLGDVAQTVFNSLFGDLMKEINDGIKNVQRQQDERAYEVFMTFECRDLLDSYRSIERGTLFERIQNALNANDRP